MARVGPSRGARRCLMPVLKSCGADLLRAYLVTSAGSRRLPVQRYFLDNQWNILGCLAGQQKLLDKVFPPVKKKLSLKSFDIPLLCTVLVACKAGSLQTLVNINDIRKIWNDHTHKKSRCICDVRWTDVLSTMLDLAVATGNARLISRVRKFVPKGFASTSDLSKPTADTSKEMLNISEPLAGLSKQPMKSTKQPTKMPKSSEQSPKQLTKIPQSTSNIKPGTTKAKSPRQTRSMATRVCSVKPEKKSPVRTDHHMEQFVRLVLEERCVEDAAKDPRLYQKDFVDVLFTFLRKDRKVKRFLRTKNSERHKTWEISKGRKPRLTFLQIIVSLQMPTADSSTDALDYISSRILRKLHCEHGGNSPVTGAAVETADTKKKDEKLLKNRTNESASCWKCEQKRIALKVAVSFGNRRAIEMLLESNSPTTESHLLLAVKSGDEDVVCTIIRALKDRKSWQPDHHVVQDALCIAKFRRRYPIVETLKMAGVKDPGDSGKFCSTCSLL